MARLIAQRSGPLTGDIAVPGDKSVSHRALMLAALAVGETRVRGLLEGDDVLRTAAALAKLGARIERGDDGAWRVSGVGVGGFREPDDVLDMGNSGTAARLLMGLLATSPFYSVMTGDASLRKRPMKRVSEPLSRFGARILCRSGGRLPASVEGARSPTPVVERLKVPSAQVKSAILLAGLNAPGETTVIEPEATRDHTERLLGHFGADIAIEELKDGARAIALVGQPELVARDVDVAGDPSSAAFLAVAALIRPGSSLIIRNIGVNPLRSGLFATLIEMGADIVFENRRETGGEPVADLRVRASRLKGVRVPASRAPSMIDEYPILAIAAAAAEGETLMEGLAELKVKESDRIAATADGLEACGVRVGAEGDALCVSGGREIAGGATVVTHHDHRIAMSFLMLGQIAKDPIAVDDDSMIATSFPGFVDLARAIGGRIERAGGETA